MKQELLNFPYPILCALGTNASPCAGYLFNEKAVAIKEVITEAKDWPKELNLGHLEELGELNFAIGDAVDAAISAGANVLQDYLQVPKDLAGRYFIRVEIRNQLKTCFLNYALAEITNAKVQHQQIEPG